MRQGVSNCFSRFNPVYLGLFFSCFYLSSCYPPSLLAPPHHLDHAGSAEVLLPLTLPSLKASTAAVSSSSGPDESAHLTVDGDALDLPRSTYCSAVVHELPGGCRYVDLPCEHIWEELVEISTVQVGRSI